MHRPQPTAGLLVSRLHCKALPPSTPDVRSPCRRHWATGKALGPVGRALRDRNAGEPAGRYRESAASLGSTRNHGPPCGEQHLAASRLERHFFKLLASSPARIFTVHLDGLSQGFTQVRKKLLARFALRIHARHFLNPADPPPSVTPNNGRIRSRGHQGLRLRDLGNVQPRPREYHTGYRIYTGELVYRVITRSRDTGTLGALGDRDARALRDRNAGEPHGTLGRSKDADADSQCRRHWATGETRGYVEDTGLHVRHGATHATSDSRATGPRRAGMIPE
jgi:hypothetical protein